MISRKQGSYAAVYALHVLLLSTCAARTNATPGNATAAPLSVPVPLPVPLLPPALSASPSPAPLPPPPKESAPLEFFRAALARTKQQQTKTHIVFFGDSHVAADFMSGRVRERLQSEYGDGGPGFVMTGRPWRSYRHSRAELLEAKGLKATYVRKRPEADTLALGLAGVAFTPAPTVEPEQGSEANDTGKELTELAPEAPLVRLRITNALIPSGRPTHYELFFLPSPAGAAPHVALDGQPPVTSPATSPNYFAFDAKDDQPHDVTIASGLDVPLTLFGLVAELEGPGVVLDTLGIPGARARAQLYWQQSLLHEHIQRRTPDLWVLSYGTNESTDVTQPIRDYAGHLHEVVSRMRAAAPQASCLLVGPTDFPERVKVDPRAPARERKKVVYQARERTAQINELQRKTAAEFGCAFFDVIESMGGPLSMLTWAKAEPPLGAKDLIHFTRRGYALLGDRIADTLLGVTTAEPTPVASAPAVGSTSATSKRSRK